MKKNKAIDKYNKSIKRYYDVTNGISGVCWYVDPEPIKIDIDRLSGSVNGRIAIRLTSILNNLYSDIYKGSAKVSTSKVKDIIFLLFAVIPCTAFAFIIAVLIRILSSF